MVHLPAVAVRAAVAEDFPAWFELFSTVAGEGLWLGREAPLDRSERRADFLAGLATPERASLVALDGDALVGAAGVRHEAHGIASFGMFVAPEARGGGVGRALVEAAVGWARSIGAHKVSIEVWPHNAAALALYRRCGFVVEGRHARQYRRANGELWDALALGLVLDTSAPGSPHPDAPT